MHTFVVLAYKESSYLEECIKSVLNQKYKSKVVIATSTPNKYISDIANKYNLEIIENKNHKNIGGDFDFALSCGNTEIVTIAHQDDIYDYEYSYEIVENYKKNKDAIILFSDYYELRDKKRVYSNTNLKIKRILLLPLRIFKGKSKIIKRSSIRFGNAICCPAVSFVKNKTKDNVFSCDFKCDVDWYAWEKLSHLNGSFVFISKPLMGHRVHSESTTTEIIHDNIRTKEDLEMFKKFWPNFIAKKINKFYMKSEDSNNIKED
jgi:glycosyltransferase involved in cell wall biosynthesis